MNQVERFRHIQEALSKQDFVSMDKLCDGLGASRATVRRDLILLERERSIRRVRGGVMSTVSREEALDFRRLSISCHEEKARIGKAAASLVADGQTIILGGGSTVAEVAQCLLSRPIQIITNSIPVAMIFWECKQTEVTLTGGYLYPRLYLQGKIRKRRNLIRDSLPNALDILSASVGAGLGFAPAIKQLSEKMHNALGREFEHVHTESQALGSSMPEALGRMAERCQVEEMTRFVSTMSHALQLGTPIGVVLSAQADDLRTARENRAIELAQKAPLKMLFPMVGCIFPTLFILLLGPALLQVAHTLAGK